MKRNKAYIDLVTKRQAILERVKTAQVKEFSGVFKGIEGLVRQTILGLEDDLATLNVVQLNNVLQVLRRDQGQLFKKATTKFLGNSSQIAAVTMAQEVIDLQKTVALPAGSRLKQFSQRSLFKKVIERPLATNGDLLKDFIGNFSQTETNRVSRAVRLGHSQGKTNQQIVRDIIGTKARNYRDGVVNVSRRHAETTVRTSVQHVASTARQETWEANRDVVKRYRFLATLDSATSNVCRSLDRQEFEFGEGPIPPVHPNCRSTTIPILDPKFDFLSKGRTRSSEQGPVPAETSYYDWLKKQDEQTQLQILGPKRTKLFRDGGMTPTKFRDLQFDKNFVPLTLAEMEKLEPGAFKLAGISSAKPTKVVKATPTKVVKTTPTKVVKTTPTKVVKKAATKVVKAPPSNLPDFFKREQRKGSDLGNTDYLNHVVDMPAIKANSKGSFFSALGNKVEINTKRHKTENNTIGRVLAHEMGHKIHHEKGWVTRTAQPNAKVVEAYAEAKKLVNKDKDFYLSFVGANKGAGGGKFPVRKQYPAFFQEIRKNPKFKNLNDDQIGESIASFADTLGSLTNNLIGWGHSDAYYKNGPAYNSGQRYGHLAEFFAHSVENRYGHNPIFEEYAPELHKLMAEYIADLLK